MKRFHILLTGYCAIGAVILPAFIRPAPRLVYGETGSSAALVFDARF